MDRNDLSNFVYALSVVYTIMIFAYIVLGLLPIPYSSPLARVREFLDQTVTPYLNLFRRFIPSVGMFDFSPMVGLLVLWFGTRIITGIISG